MEKTETEKKTYFAMVKSPSKDAHLRKGNGFSLAEIKAAGKSIALLREYKIKIDYFRRSAHEENIELLKPLKITEKKGKKRKTYEPKEKKIKKKSKAKKKITPIKEEEITTEKSVKEDKPKEKELPTKKSKIKSKIVEKSEAKKISKEKVGTKEIPLTILSGLGASTAKKFTDVGVESVEQLCKEDPAELGRLISGCTEARISKWIDEGKKLLND